jgi:transcriptional regulator with XRE-family HTH domain
MRQTQVRRGEGESLPYAAMEEEGEFARVLQEMRLRAGVTVKDLAETMGITTGSLHQYLYRQRGDGGSSTMRWFLRYVEACGGAVTLTYPTTDSPRRQARVGYQVRRNQTLAQVFAEGDRHDATQSDA